MALALDTASRESQWPWNNMFQKKRMKNIVINSVITLWALDLTPEAAMGNAAALITLIFPGSVSVEHWGLLQDLSNCCWLSCCLQPKIRMKILGQPGGAQISFLGCEECSWHEKSIWKSQGHGGRTDLPLFILWATHPHVQLVRHDTHMLCRLLAMLSPSRSASLEPNPAVRSTGQSAWTQPWNHPSPLTLWETLQGALLSA